MLRFISKSNSSELSSQWAERGTADSRDTHLWTCLAGWGNDVRTSRKCCHCPSLRTWSWQKCKKSWNLFISGCIFFKVWPFWIQSVSYETLPWFVEYRYSRINSIMNTKVKINVYSWWNRLPSTSWPVKRRSNGCQSQKEVVKGLPLSANIYQLSKQAAMFIS